MDIEMEMEIIKCKYHVTIIYDTQPLFNRRDVTIKVSRQRDDSFSALNLITPHFAVSG